MHKVLHILACGKSGGIETLVAEYARESQHKNYFVFVWEDGFYEKKIREYGCNTYFLDAGKKGTIKSTKELFKIVSEIRPEAIVTHHGSPMIRVYVTLLTLFYRQTPVLMYVHCDAKDELKGSNKIARKVINVMAAKSAKRIIAISQYVKKSVIENFNASPNKIEVIYNGVDVARFSKKCMAAHDLVRLVFIGRLVQVKGVQVALQALKICLDRGMNISFIIVGDGSYKAQLETLASELEIDEHCRFAGMRTDVPAILEDADIFVHPCVWEEGFGIGIVEAMAAGKICICSNSGAIPEIITEGVNGYLVDKGNPEALAGAIALAIENKNQWKNMQEQAIQTAQKFSTNRFVKCLDASVEEIIDER